MTRYQRNKNKRRFSTKVKSNNNNIPLIGFSFDIDITKHLTQSGLESYSTIVKDLVKKINKNKDKKYKKDLVNILTVFNSFIKQSNKLDSEAVNALYEYVINELEIL